MRGQAEGRYLSSIALSLFFFNLLPLPGTDGSQLLKALLALIKPRHHASPTPTQKPFQATLSSSARINLPTININTYREYELSDDEDDGDEEEGRRGRREERWKTRLRKSIEAGCVAVLIGWIAGWGMLALLRSS
jgi:S2P endopeptidase